MARVYQGDRVALTSILGPVERVAYRVFLVDDPRSRGGRRMHARCSCSARRAGWCCISYCVRRRSSRSTRRGSPIRARGTCRSTPPLRSCPTRAGSTTRGETTLSDFSQMAGITVASFTSCATGMAVAAAVIRGLGRRGTDRLGNFWVDLTRSLLYVLLPICRARRDPARRDRGTADARALPERPRPDRALADDRHRPGRLAGGDQAACPATAAGSSTPTPRTPSRTPPAISNFVEILLMLLIPAAFTATFGRMIGRPRQGWALYAAMLAIFVAGTARHLRRRDARHPRPARRRREHGRPRRLDRRQHGGQGAALRHRRLGVVRVRRNRERRRRGQQRRGVLHRPRRRRWRWPT